nr:MAG TPA: hypothetical protein [Caudoviricetes sp.]
MKWLILFLPFRPLIFYTTVNFTSYILPLTVTLCILYIR